MSRYAFDFAGREYNEGEFGPDFVTELERMCAGHLPRPPRRILEWGAGITTLVFLELGVGWSSELLLTLDTDPGYQAAVLRGRYLPPWLDARCLDEIGPRAGQNDPEYTYSTFPLSLRRKFDLILIDGRRRVECAYVAALLSHEDTVVLLHDYRRTRYQPILGVFEIIEDGVQFRALRLRRELVTAISAGAERVAAALPERT